MAFADHVRSTTRGSIAAATATADDEFSNAAIVRMQRLLDTASRAVSQHYHGDGGDTSKSKSPFHLDFWNEKLTPSVSVGFGSGSESVHPATSCESPMLISSMANDTDMQI